MTLTDFEFSIWFHNGKAWFLRELPKTTKTLDELGWTFRWAKNSMREFIESLPPEPEECGCGGPPGHVQRGINCRLF